MDFSLRVTPEVLEQRADDFWKVIGRIDNHFKRIDSISQKTQGYWKGEAGEEDRRSFSAMKDEVNAILRRLDEHPSDLLKMAGIYRSAERAAAAESTQLKTNQIV